MALNRGDIVTVADRGGDFTGKPRPALVVQSDLFSELGSVALCPITSTDEDVPLLRIDVAPDDANGLREPSWIAVDLIYAAKSARIGQHIGRLDAAIMLAVNRALLIFLGLAA